MNLSAINTDAGAMRHNRGSSSVESATSGYDNPGVGTNLFNHLHQSGENHVNNINHRSNSSSSSGSGGHATPPALAPPPSSLGMNMNPLSTYPWGAGSLPLGRTSGFPSSAMAAVASLGRRYNCKLCPAMFDSKAELQVHTQVHMREAKPYKCTHCPKNFANSSYLSQHMRIHLGIKPFGPCQYCGRKFTQLSHLQQHLRTHTGEKPYKCRYPACEKAFSQLSNLQSHSRCHQTDKPFKCNSCYKCFNDEQALLEHIPKHNETKHVKKCICPFCGKSYSQHSYLAKHMTKHADKKSGLRGPSMSMSDDSGLMSPMCAIHGIPDGCGEVSPTTAFPLTSYPNHMMPSQAAYGGAVADSAFTRLGLGSLSRMNQRNPYSSFYENFKPPGHTGALHPGAPFHNQLIRLDEIRNYANMPASADAFAMLRKQEPRDAAY